MGWQVISFLKVCIIFYLEQKEKLYRQNL